MSSCDWCQRCMGPALALVLAACASVPLQAKEAARPVMLGPVRMLRDSHAGQAVKLEAHGTPMEVSTELSTVTSAAGYDYSSGAVTTRTEETRSPSGSAEWAVARGLQMSPRAFAHTDEVACRSVVIFALFSMGVSNSCTTRFDGRRWQLEAAPSPQTVADEAAEAKEPAPQEPAGAPDRPAEEVTAPHHSAVPAGRGDNP